jgi:hypothetical protein
VRHLIEYGCVKISGWFLDEKGNVKIDYPKSISDIPGVLVIANDTEVMYIGATSHYGPRINDFMHSSKGDTTSARIHGHITRYLSEGKKDLSLFRIDDQSPYAVKAKLKECFFSMWNK